MCLICTTIYLPISLNNEHPPLSPPPQGYCDHYAGAVLVAHHFIALYQTEPSSAIFNSPLSDDITYWIAHSSISCTTLRWIQSPCNTQLNPSPSQTPRTTRMPLTDSLYTGDLRTLSNDATETAETLLKIINFCHERGSISQVRILF